MPTVKEKDLDKALEHELRTNPQFAAWFLNKTRFREQKATCVYSRSNNPYGKVPFEELNPAAHQDLLEFAACNCNTEEIRLS
jgi:hypothetical protein